MSTLQRETDSLDEKEDDVELYLTFLFDDEEYGITTLRVQETKNWNHAISTTNPSHYLGGSMVPVVDLRLNLGRQTL